jgi:drug/metabolite transporter (DMT)-like permease
MTERLRNGAASTGVAAAFAAVALWSTNALAAKFALAELGVIQVLALQFGAATAALAKLRAARSARVGGAGETVRRSSLGWLDVLGGVLVGVVGLAGTIFLQYLAFATAPIVEANVLAYGWPLFAALWAALAHRSRRTLAGVPLAMVGFAGVALILGSGPDLGFADGATVGYVAALASAACMTFYTVASGRSRVPAAALLLPATGFGTVFALALCFGGFAPWAWAGQGAWVASAYAGVGPMAGGFLLWRVAMSGGGAKRLAPLGYATPLLSTALLLLFGETFTPSTLTGALLILVCSIGVLMVDRKWRD